MQETQQFYLELEVQFADFVQEQRSPVGYVASFGTLTNTAYNRTGNGYVRISFIDRIAPPPPPIPGVPEPSTWAMLIIGFGLCGAAMRRRRMRSRLSYN